MVDIWLLSDLHDDFEAFAWPKPPKGELTGYLARSSAVHSAP